MFATRRRSACQQLQGAPGHGRVPRRHHARRRCSSPCLGYPAKSRRSGSERNCECMVVVTGIAVGIALSVALMCCYVKRKRTGILLFMRLSTMSWDVARAPERGGPMTKVGLMVDASIPFLDSSYHRYNISEREIVWSQSSLNILFFHECHTTPVH